MIIHVVVKPDSGQESVDRLGGEEYLVRLKKPAIDNKANLELLKVLRKHFKAEVRIVKGKRSKKKIIEVITD